MGPRRQLTRRSFLKAAVTGLAVPMIAPSSVFGLGGQTPPSERITVAFIGTGKMSNDYHMSELLKFPDVQALAVCDVDTTRREHAKKRVEGAYSKDSAYKGCSAYVDFREVIQRKDIEERIAKKKADVYKA